MRSIRRTVLAAVLGLASFAVIAPANATVPGTNGKIAFDSSFGEGSQVFSMAATGGTITNLTNNPGHNNVWPSWSPDGTRVAFATNRDNNFEIYVMDAGGTNPSRLTNNTAFDTEPAWSPDGSKISFATNRDGNFEIYVMNANGSSPARLTINSADDREPTWSPDGSKIAFDTNRSGNYEIETMNAADGSSLSDVTNNSARDFGPSWSPDGAKIAFWTNRDGNDEVYSMNANGSGPTDLTNNANADSAPTWSPDGTKIAFVSTRATSWEIFSMNANGLSQTQLTFASDGAGRGNPDWQVAGGGGSTAQPDGQIKKSTQSAYVGDNVYNLTGSAQTVTARVVQGSTTTFDIKDQNDDLTADTFTISGPGNKTGFTVHYYAGLTGTTDITSQVTAGTYTISNIASGASKTFRIVIHVKTGVAAGTIKAWLIVATSSNDPSKADAVKAKENVTG